ncbi:MAG: hypothetical protein VYC39_18450 [Myxococcota bacterium]|nr:hypothetical protein [Myxococcota bacterium]
MNLRTLLLVSIQLLWIPHAFADEVQLAGQIFTQYGSRNQGDVLSNEFAITRAELGTYVKVSDYWHGEIRLEGFRSATPQSLIGLDLNSFAVRVNRAWGGVQMKLSDDVTGQINFGLVIDPWIVTAERSFGLRGLQPTIYERSRLFDTADLGVSLRLDCYDELFRLHASLTNGEGRRQVEQNASKNLTVVASTTPLKMSLNEQKLSVRLALIYRLGSVGVANVESSRYGGQVSVEHPMISIGGALLRAQGVNFRGDQVADILTVWGHGRVIKNWIHTYVVFDQWRADISLEDSALREISAGLYTNLGYDGTQVLRLFAGTRILRYESNASPLAGATEAFNSVGGEVKLELTVSNMWSMNEQ